MSTGNAGIAQGIELQVMKVTKSHKPSFDTNFRVSYEPATWASFAIFVFLAFVTFTVELNAISIVLHIVSLWLMLRCAVRSSVLSTPHAGSTRKPVKHEEGLFARRYCDKCGIRQPLRTKHCSETGRCVATYDHYCFFVGCAISEQNHKIFVTMLLFASTCVAWDVWILSKSVWQNTGFLFGFYITVLGLSVFPLILVVSLFLYHVYLIITAQTTWEHLSRENITYLQGVPDGVNPFSRGVLGNIKEFIFRPSNEPPIEWAPTWREGDDSSTCFILDNQYYSCF